MTRVSLLGLSMLLGLSLACGSGEAPGAGADDAAMSPTPDEPAPQPPVTTTEPAPPTDSDAPPPAPVDPADYRPAPTLGAPDTPGALRFVGELEMSPTAGEWATWHPEWASGFRLHDTNLHSMAPEGFASRPRWCLLAKTVDAPGTADSVLTRMAARESSARTYHDLAETIGAPVTIQRFYFYGGEVPDVPADYSLPPVSPGMEYQLRSCRLGLVTTEVYGTGREDAVAAELTGAYTVELGEPEDAEVSLEGLDPARFTSWRDGEVTVGVGQRRSYAAPVTFAFLPILGRTAAVGRDDYGDVRAWEAEVYGLALEAAAIPEDVEADIAAFHARDDPRYEIPSDFRARDELVRRIVGGLTERPPDIESGSAAVDLQAARFLTADLFLHRYYGSVPSFGYGLADPDDYEAWLDTFQSEYAQLGAEYWVHEWPEPEIVYSTRSLADSAAASPGEAGGWGDRARTVVMARGCRHLPVFDQGPALLQRIDDPRFAARLRVLLGDAYATVVRWQLMGWERERRFDDLDAVRRAARDHYVRAIQGDLTDTEKARVWRYAWAVTHNLSMESRWECPGPA